MGAMSVTQEASRRAPSRSRSEVRHPRHGRNFEAAAARLLAEQPTEPVERAGRGQDVDAPIVGLVTVGAVSGCRVAGAARVIALGPPPARALRQGGGRWWTS